MREQHGLLYDIKEQFTIEKALMRLFASWCAAALYGMFRSPVGFDKLDFAKAVSAWEILIVLLGAFILLTALDLLLAERFPTDPAAVALFGFWYAMNAVAYRRNLIFALGVLIVLGFMGYYLLRDDKLRLSKLRLGKRLTLAIVIAAGAFFVLFVGGLTALRYLNYGNSTYDFGIFAQMFYYMKETGLPTTTCERTQELSHFAVHLSPIFYVLLPGYFLFPSPAYLQVAQAVVLATGLIPLYLLARHFELGNKLTAAICVAYCLYPGIAGGCFYDIHENFFLTPLLLWVFYCMEKRKWGWMYVSALLTCLVKEDAPLYVACIALFLFLVRKERIHGAWLFLGAVLYFLVASMLLQTYGEGANALNGRLGNFASNADMGLLGILRTIFVNPAYVISEIFQNAVVNNQNREKLNYILLMLVPLAGLPLLNRRLTQLVLVIPFVLINLMSNYQYMHMITYQYHFGTSALFFFLVVINLKELGTNYRKYMVPFMVTACAVLFTSTLYTYTNNVTTFLSKHEEFKQMDAVLATIPEEASVQASAFLVPKLSQRRILYDVNYNHRRKEPHATEYIALDMRGSRKTDSQKYIDQYTEKGYEIVEEMTDILVVLHKPPALSPGM